MTPHHWLAGLILIGGLVAAPTAPSAKIPFFLDYGSEKLVKVADFPEWPYYLTQEGEYFDAGVIYKRIRVFLLPLWNYDVRWCGYISDEQYVSLTPLQVRDYARMAKVELPETPPLPLWDQWGGKLVLLVVVGGVALGVWSLVQDAKEPSA